MSDYAGNGCVRDECLNPKVDEDSGLCLSHLIVEHDALQGRLAAAMDRSNEDAAERDRLQDERDHFWSLARDVHKVLESDRIKAYMLGDDLADRLRADFGRGE